MKILYVATDQRVDAPTGGSVHVREVAHGLVSLGHEVHVLAAGPETDTGDEGFIHHAAETWLAHRLFRWTAQSQARRLIDSHGIQLLVERYYNFGGEGIRAAFRAGIPSVLEVNSPVIDHPQSWKSRIDALLILRPMRWLREDLCAKADALLSPLPSIVPDDVAAQKVHRVHWGANVDRFRPGVVAVPQDVLEIPAGRRVVVFSGSFRSWHGADMVVRIASELSRRGSLEKFAFLLLGDGPSFQETQRLASELGVQDHVFLTGGVDYDDVPGYLARADIGIAPYQPSRHGQLRLGFYWSPLKIFEYMAMGLPVVTLRNEPLAEIVRPEQEGLLVDEHDLEGWATALERLGDDPTRAGAMGRAARDRVSSEFSWQRHCEQLNEIFRNLRR